jgi:hypothetical protein
MQHPAVAHADPRDRRAALLAASNICHGRCEAEIEDIDVLRRRTLLLATAFTIWLQQR